MCELDGVWLEAPNTPGVKQLPKWQRCAFVEDDGDVFLPCGAFGNETQLIMCAAFDGTRMINDNGHGYVSSEWLKSELPKLSDTIDSICKKIVNHAQPPQA